MVADCAHGIKEMFGGSKNADVDNDINLKITNGSTLERVFGGNNTSGAINGSSPSPSRRVDVSRFVLTTCIY